MHLLLSKLYCFFSSSGRVFMFMCHYSLCSVVYRFLKKQVCFLLFIHNVQVSINNNELNQEQKRQTPQDVFNKDADKT